MVELVDRLVQRAVVKRAVKPVVPSILHDEEDGDVEDDLPQGRERGAVVQAELRGNPLVDVLRIQAEVSRRKRTVRAEESAAKAGVALAGPLILVFLTILILIVAPIVMKLQGSNF